VSGAVILAATGLGREARIVAGAGVIVIVGGGAADLLEQALERAAPRAMAVLSVGIAGALAPGLRPGDRIIGASVGDVATDPSWRAHLRAALPDAIVGAVAGSDRIAASPADKQALHMATGALAVDMESHVAARVAARRGLPLAILRVISDAASASLPPAALIAMRPGGGVDLRAVLGSLARNPAQTPALIGTAINAERAFRSLFRGYDALRRIGILPPDLGELTLNMP